MSGCYEICIVQGTSQAEMSKIQDGGVASHANSRYGFVK